MFAQLWYDGVEQFYCQADSCVQDVTNNGTGTTVWNCQNLLCKCIVGTTFCGGGSLDLTSTMDNLVNGAIDVSCIESDNANTGTCNFTESVLQSIFGESGLELESCTFGECVSQSVIDTSSNSTSSTSTPAKQLSGGIIAGLAVVGGLVLLALLLLVWGFASQRKARKGGLGPGQFEKSGGVGVQWTDVSYIVPGPGGMGKWFGGSRKDSGGTNDDKVVLDSLSGSVRAGEMMAILGPSGTFVTQILFISTLLKRSPGAGKTTLVEILAGKNKSGYTAGQVSFPATSSDAVTSPRVGFVPQRDILPPMLTVFEALLFAARLRLPETVSDSDKHARVHAVMEKLGIEDISNVRIGWAEGSGRRGISGGEMRRVSIGLELVARPDVLILDEPTSGPSFILLCHIFIYLILIGVCRLGLGLGGKSGQCPSRSCSRS
jgi:ABC-type nitrate/sulfonate/bicarbonate transport system ATPase subunit